MARPNRWVARLAIAIAIAAVAISLYRWWKRRLPSDFSRGGVELTYDVDAARAVDEKFARGLDEAVQGLRREGVVIGAIKPQPRAATLAVTGLDEAKLARALAGLPLAARIQPDGALALSIADARAEQVRDAAMQQVARVAHGRVAALGLCKPTVRQAERRLIVGLPGVDEAGAARVKEALSSTGKLELRLVAETPALAAARPSRGAPADDRWTDPGGSAHALAKLCGAASDLAALHQSLPALPGGVDALAQRDGDRVCLVPVTRGGVSGESVIDARVEEQKGAGGVGVSVTLDKAGAEALDKLTRDHVGARLAIVLDGNVLQTPIILDPIAGGRAWVTFPDADAAAQRRKADLLALTLHTGPLPVPLTLIAEKRIGPSEN